MADLNFSAAYGSVVEDDGQLYIGFAEGEDEDEAYVLFRRSIQGGPVWFEVTDESFGAEDAIDSVLDGPEGLEIILRPDKAAAFGWAATVSVKIGPGCEYAQETRQALREMLGDRMI